VLPPLWTATRAVVAALLAGALLTSCSADSSSSTPSAAETATEPADGSSAEASSSSAPVTDTASQALCSALTNAVGASTPWHLGEAQAGARDLGGVSVPSCEVGAADEGDPQTRLTVAYLPSAEGLAGLDLLAGLCQAVVRAQEPTADGRACAVPTKAPAKAGTDLRRADLTSKDAGVLVLSFNSDDPSYRRTSVDDLATVGQALAVDQLLAMAVG
jgi:hypothetical protein